MPSTPTLPWSWYVDPAIATRERLVVFGDAWHYVGHVDEVPLSGFHPVDVAGVPVVLTQPPDGEVLALVNVCRHRGAIVCESPGEGRLRCPYHAWTYDLDGGLVTAPRSDREPDFDAASHHLPRLPIGRWGPFVFVRPAKDGVPFDDWIDDTRRRVAEVLDVDALRFLRRTSGDYAANWKVCVENFLECYHCRIAHPAFAKVIATGPDDYRLVTAQHGSTQYGPVREGWTGKFDPRGPIGRGQFHVLYPATAINIMPGHPNLSIGPVVPTSPTTTHRFLDYFVGPDVDEAWIASMLEFDDRVGAEDVPLVESVQRGMEAGVHDHGTLILDSESLIAHFGDWVRHRLS
jgi:choline monooxygenase